MPNLTATWVPNTELPDDAIGWLGGMSSNPTWDEYISIFEEEIVPALEAIRQCHQDNNMDLYGDDLSMDPGGYFQLSDGRAITMSMRAWGDFRQAMDGKREGYMRYYMR